MKYIIQYTKKDIENILLENARSKLQDAIYSKVKVDLYAVNNEEGFPTGEICSYIVFDGNGIEEFE